MHNKIIQNYTSEMNEYFTICKENILSQLRYAKSRVPHFIKTFALVNIENIRTYDDFSKMIPILNSDTFVEKPLDMIGEGVNVIFERASSATSGKSKEIYLTKSDLESWIKDGRLSITPYFESGMTVTHSCRNEENYLSGLDDAVIYSAGKVTTFNAGNPADIYKKITEADILLDYSEMIYFVSEQIKKYISKNKTNTKYNLIVSYTGEYLNDEDIQKIIDNFASANITAKVYSEYSLSEIGPVACSNGIENNLFEPIYNKICFVEVLDNNGNPSLNGEIIITTLNREGTNLIRYASGDLGELIFINSKPHILLKGRKKGIKIASLFIRPQQIVAVVREKVGPNFFCYISVQKQNHFGKIDIKIITPNKVEHIKSLKRFLLEELEYTDDIKRTVELNITIDQRELTETELRKSFSFIAKEK